MASGGAGAPSAPAAPAAPAASVFATSGDVESAGNSVGPITAIVYGGTPAAGAFFRSLFPKKEESTPSTTKPKARTALGKLSDPDVSYSYDKSTEDPKATSDLLSIFFGLALMTPN